MSEIKYKLLKELPFCSIGTIGVIEEYEIRFYYNNNNNYEFYHDTSISKLIEEGWIEKCKSKTQKELVNEIYIICDLRDFRNIILNKYEIKEK